MFNAKFSKILLEFQKFIRMVLIVQVHEHMISSPYQMKSILSSWTDVPVVHCG